MLKYDFNVILHRYCIYDYNNSFFLTYYAENFACTQILFIKNLICLQKVQ